jgi:hypothetical protein
VCNVLLGESTENIFPKKLKGSHWLLVFW